MIELAAVIQEVVANQKASTLVLDVATVDFTQLADLIDEEVMVTITPRLSASPAPEKHRKKPNKPPNE